ncbi:MAG: hypothetical protein Q8M16_11660 [Pirellulaceae bacterium]|nr:hypothetical protein [Pirellulaceae bacterium]
MNKPISTWTQTFFKLGYTLRRIWHEEPDYANNYTPLELEVLEDRQMLSGFGGDDPMGGTGGTGGSGDPIAGLGGGAVGGNNVLSGLSGQSPTTLFSYGVSPDRINLPEYWSKLPSGYSYSGTNPWDFRPANTTPPTQSNYRLSEQTELEGFPGTYIVTLSHFEIQAFQVTSVGSQSLGNYEYTENVRAKLTQTIIETATPTSVRDSFESGTNATFTSYIRFTATLEYKFKLNLLDGQTTSFDQNVVKEDTTTEFNWTTTIVKSPFSEGEYLESNYTRTSVGQASISGTVLGQTSIRVQAARSGTDIAYTVSGNGRNWVPTGQELKTTINHTATAQTIALTVLPEAELSDLAAFQRLTIAKGDTGVYERYSINGDVKTKFDRSFSIASTNLRKSSGSPSTLTGSLNKTYNDVSTTENNLTITWLTIEGKANVVPLGDAAPSDGASATLSEDGTAAVPIQIFTYRPAREDELLLGESTWLLNRDWSKVTDKDKFTVSASNRLRTEYLSNGTRRDTLEHKTDATVDTNLAQPLLRTVFEKNLKTEGVSHEYFTERRKVSGTDSAYANEETTEVSLSSDHQTGPTTTEIRARVSKLDNQPGYVSLSAAQYSGEIRTKVFDKTTHDILEKDTWKKEKRGPLVRTVSSDDVATTAIGSNNSLLVESIARITQVDQNTRKEVHDDSVNIEYRFVDPNTVKIIDKSQYDSKTFDYSGYVDSDKYIKQWNYHPDRYFDYEYSDKTKELKTGSAIIGDNSGAHTIRKIKNDTEVTMLRTPPANDDDVQTAATVTPITNESTLAIDLSDFEYHKKSGTATVEMAASSRSDYEVTQNTGTSSLLTKFKTIKTLDSFEHAYTDNDQAWTRSGHMIDTVNFTKNTTFDFNPAGSAPLTDRERFQIVKVGNSTQTGEIVDTIDKRLRQVNSSEGPSNGMTLEAFRSKWHSSDKDAVSGNAHFTDWTDNRNETNTMKTDVRNDLNLTYVVTELPETDSGDNSEADQATYQSVVTGTKTEVIKNEVKTFVNSSYQQRLHGNQQQSVEESTAWGTITNIGSVPEADRTRTHRSATTDWKRSIDGKPGETLVKIRKSTSMEFAPNEVEVTVKAVNNAGIAGEGEIVSKTIDEKLNGYVYETKQVFIGNLVLYFTPDANGKETVAGQSGTHGFHSRSFTEWNAASTGEFLHSTANSSLSVNGAGMTYTRTIGSGEDQGAIFQDTTTQTSALPEFDEQWVQTGFLRSIDDYQVKQTNIGSTETIVRWRMPNEHFDSMNQGEFTERVIDRINNSTSEMQGSADGTSITNTWKSNGEHRTWNQTTDGFVIHRQYSVFTGWTQNESFYDSYNRGTHKFDENHDYEAMFLGTQQTGFNNEVVRKYDSNGVGYSLSVADGNRHIVNENWAGWNTATTVRSSIYGEDNDVDGDLRITRMETLIDRWGNSQLIPASFSDMHFYVESLKTFNFHRQGDVEFVEYTTYRSNLATGWLTAVGGGLGVIVGVFTAPTVVGAGLAAISLDTFVGGLRTALTGRQSNTLMSMAAGGAYEWILQTSTNNSDFELTDEERQAAGVIVEFALTFGAAAAARIGKAVSQFKVAADIFRQSAGACDKLSKLGRAMKSYREAGKVLNGTSDVQTSVRGILDNYCFVGTVGVSAYNMENRWATVSTTPDLPMAATPTIARSNVASWIVIGAGTVALMQVIAGRTAPRNSEESEEAWPELAWA